MQEDYIALLADRLRLFCRYYQPVQPKRPLDPLQRRGERHCGGTSLQHLLDRRLLNDILRQDHVPTDAFPLNPGGNIEGPSEVVELVIRINRDSGTVMDTNFNHQWWIDVVQPVELADPRLHRQCRTHGPVWTGEDCHHGITDGFDQRALILLDAVDQE